MAALDEAPVMLLQRPRQLSEATVIIVGQRRVFRALDGEITLAAATADRTRFARGAEEAATDEMHDGTRVDCFGHQTYTPRVVGLRSGT